MKLNVAIVQCDIVWENSEVNLKQIGHTLNNIKHVVDLIVLPEMFHCGFTMQPERSAQVDGGEVLSWMKRQAGKLNATIMGSVVTQVGKDYVNRLYVVSSNQVQWYDKRHLFTMGQEHKYYKPGKERKVIEVKGWKICPLICYDLRFPVWSRNDCNYDALVYVANWPASRRDVWNTLLKARAIENQCFVLGVNRVGNDVANAYVGDSQVIDAKGIPLVALDDQAQIAYVTLDKNELENFRAKFPVLKDRDVFNVSDC